MVASVETAERPTTIDDFYSDGSPPRVIAHRGFSGIAPENTMAAFQKAIEIGADMVEFDVTVSADGEVVVIHDETLNRTTNGRGKIHKKSLAKLRRLDAGSWFSPDFADQRIPTLDEVLKSLGGKILMNIEIKPEAVAHDVSAKVAALVFEHRMVDQVVVSSFSPTALEQMRQLAPEIRTASLYKKKIHQGIDPFEIVNEVGASAFNINYKYLTLKMLRSCERNSIPVAVYTVNEKEAMRGLISKGVGAFFTDYPDRLMEVLLE